ncbi:hypothetical protein [Limnohabitans sp. DM1]|uniref:hypothetical protein n=1 Tax=Limnohabitans sp. DM1 TaxID=1597955 RepID=UPI000AA04BED|nr:hypothetical protein [Limnohabitans sp. DM1]
MSMYPGGYDSAIFPEPFSSAYRTHLQHLKLKGLQPKTIDAYARAIRRMGDYFDFAIDKLSPAQLWFLASEQQKADHLIEVTGVQAPKWHRTPISDISDHASCAMEVRVLRRCHEGATPPNLAINQCAATATQSGHHAPVTRPISA